TWFVYGSAVDECLLGRLVEQIRSKQSELKRSKWFYQTPQEFTDELALITYPLEYDDNLQFDIEFDLKEIEFLLYHDKDSSLKDSIDQKDPANLADIFVDSIPEMFTDEHALDYSSPPIFDEYDDDFLEVESDVGNPRLENDPGKLGAAPDRLREGPHAHVCYFNKITSTLKFPNVPNTSIKLMLFPFSLEGAARIWLEKEPPRLIFTWDDLVLKFINQFFPPSKTTNLRNEITNFQQRFDESFNQDSLNSPAGGNFLDKMPYECLGIIESKSKVHYSRNKPVVAKVSMTTSTSGVSPDVAELKDMVRALLLDKKGQNQSPAPMKAVEESCVTCGGAHSYKNCPATDGNNYHDNIQEFVSQASAVNFNQGNTGYRPLMMSNQIRPPGFPPVPNN
nr:hypothetical protein [Tanacetum cinerariifolium]